MHLLAGALGMTGRAADGAVLLGAVQALGGRAGFSPERMDPFNSPRNVEAVKSRLAVGDYIRAHAAGLRMSRADVGTWISQLDAL